MHISENVEHSNAEKEFKSDIEAIKTEQEGRIDSDRCFQSSDFETLPTPLKKYIENSGYIGKPQMSYLFMEYKNVD